ncbi:MAG: hypothetical protein QOC57_1966 [Ilumatobacteraceae bacterium]
MTWRLGVHHTAGERDDVPATSDVGRVLTCRVFCRSRRGHLLRPRSIDVTVSRHEERRPHASTEARSSRPNR